ncbi:MAG: ATPase [Phycisphaerae bacterium]|nr:ATPase [Phycisphaerae bacterium]
MRFYDLLFQRSERMLAFTFAVLILGGTLLLWMPISHGKPVSQSRPGLSLIDALFTATSAVCVTGLTVVNTDSDFSRFGQVVILSLIQLGGLGIMTFAALGAQLLGGKMSFRSQSMVADSFFQRNAATTLRRDLKRIVVATLIIEAIGAAVIYLDLLSEPGEAAPAFSAIFHSISAYCNAGFSIYPDSLVQQRVASPAFIYMIMLLIVLGGLGHAVVLETTKRVWNQIRRQPMKPIMWTLNTRIVLYMSAGLILVGTVLLLPLGIYEQSVSWFDAITNAAFQSITCRTAGFNTVDIGALPRTALMVMMVFMFIGGSPASCAGGVKTTSVATWYSQLRAWLRGNTDVTLLGRRLPPSVVARAAMIIGLGVIWCATGTMILTLTESFEQEKDSLDLMFEQVSAFGTVGLSTGVTPHLSSAGKLWITISMFVGRLGPLTAAMVISQRAVTSARYPEEQILVG